MNLKISPWSIYDSFPSVPPARPPKGSSLSVSTTGRKIVDKLAQPSTTAHLQAEVLRMQSNMNRQMLIALIAERLQRTAQSQQKLNSVTHLRSECSEPVKSERNTPLKIHSEHKITAVAPYNQQAYNDDGTPFSDDRLLNQATSNLVSNKKRHSKLLPYLVGVSGG